MTVPRSALVTGVGRGIGLAITQRLLADGWTVHGTHRARTEALDELAASSPALRLYTVELTDEAQLYDLVTRMSTVGLGAIVHNAGVIHFEDPSRFNVERWRETFDVNVTIPVRLTFELAASLPAGSAVVAIASTDALRGSYNSIAYAASKAALLNAVASLGNVLGPRGIRVNAVTPGWVATDMMTEEVQPALEITPLGRAADPAEIAAGVAWLLGGEASFATGSSLVLDGGYINSDGVLKREAGL